MRVHAARPAWRSHAVAWGRSQRGAAPVPAKKACRRRDAPAVQADRAPCLRGLLQLRVRPAQVRAALKRARAGKYGARVEARGRRREHVAEHQAPRDALADVFR